MVSINSSNDQSLKIAILKETIVMSKSIRVRIVPNKVNELSKREEELNAVGVDPDLVGIPREIKRLQAGIMEAAIEVSDEAIYEKVKYIERLNSKIKALKLELKQLVRQRGKLQCNKPSQNDLFQYCDALQDVSKGKYGDKPKGKSK